jgi:lipoate-protein ligase A
VVSFVNPQSLPSLEFQVFSYKQFDGLTNMAIDHYFASNNEIKNNPIIRFYGWNPYCLSIGYHQSIKSIDKKLLMNDGYDLITRPTGGRAIFHSEELTYSIIFPKNILTQKELYYYIHEIFTKALNKFGYNVTLARNKPKLSKLKNIATDYPCFTMSAETEVEYRGKKLIGSAQKIYKNLILQHGSILIGNSHTKLSKYLIVSQSDRNNVNEDIKSKTICLSSINRNEITPQQLEEETLRQLESNENISLIYKDIEEDLIDKARNLYKKDMVN